MDILSLIIIIFIIILIAFQLIKRSFLTSSLKKIFWIPVVAVFFSSVIFSIMQYRAWLANDVMRLVFESEDGLYAFLHNVFFAHFASYVLSLIFAGILAWSMMIINRRSGNKFFENEEILIAFLAGFLTGFPGFLFFLLGLIITYLVAHLLNILIWRKLENRVIPLYYFWLPVALSVIIISEIWLSRLPFWGLLSV